MAIRTRLMGALAVLFAVRAAGCSASDDTGGTALPSTGGYVGKGGSSGASGGQGATGGGLIIDGGDPGDGALTADSACVGETKQAEKIPLAMYILLDKSGSMTSGGNPKWSQAVNAINTFASDQSLVAIKVALQAWSGNGPCDGSVYDTPAIPMSAVPAAAPQIASWLSSLYPSGNTPTQGALLGLQKYTTQYATQNPGEKTVGLLVTDGLPTTCDTSDSTLIGIASSTYNGTPSILVYTMGMQGADFGLLDQIAQAGGTGKAFDASGGTQAFIDALQTISGSALACEFEVPVPSEGSLDPAKVNVQFTPTGGAPQQLYQVPDAASCVEWGWYYDDPIAPTRVILCPQTCDIVKADTQGRIDLILGCKTLPAS